MTTSGRNDVSPPFKINHSSTCRNQCYTSCISLDYQWPNTQSRCISLDYRLMILRRRGDERHRHKAVRAYWKVVGVKACHSPTTSWRLWDYLDLFLCHCLNKMAHRSSVAYSRKSNDPSTDPLKTPCEAGKAPETLPLVETKKVREWRWDVIQART